MDEIFSCHELLLNSQVGLKLGKAHYLILQSNTLFEEKTHAHDDPGESIFKMPKLTHLGLEINGSLVSWFLRKHVGIIGELNNKLTQVIPRLVELKHVSANLLEESTAKDYPDLIIELENAFKKNKREIEEFFSFVEWIGQIDEFGPCLLFSHPPWSCSELSCRTFPVRGKDDERVLKRCVEIVYGLIDARSGPYLARERSDMDSDWSDNNEPEDWGNRPSPITFKTAFPRTANKILKEFATYFQKIRDSAEMIQSEITRLLRGELLKNPTFLNLFITKALPAHVLESKLWDFKVTYSAWHNSTVEKLKFEIACDVAAFANTRGGLLIIGINNNREVIGVENIEAKVLQTQKILKTYFNNDDEQIGYFSLQLLNKDGNPANCIVILIPQTKDVIEVRKPNGEIGFVCPIRLTSGIDYASHRDVQVSKIDTKENNYYFAKDIADFVYFGTNVT